MKSKTVGNKPVTGINGKKTQGMKFPKPYLLQTEAGHIQWYEANTGNHQGLIIDEKTGDNIAVTYKKEHASMIIQACNSHEELLEACKETLSALTRIVTTDIGLYETIGLDEQVALLREAVANAEKGKS